MFLIIWILVGALSGWIASKLMGEDASMGALGNIVVGMVGSIIGGSLYTLLSTGTITLDNAVTGLNFPSILLSIVGAVILLWLVRLMNRK
jgi:uncharacterized membrane protein YeaQ/YmgE (transglycosylase-associated protein family)